MPDDPLVNKLTTIWKSQLTERIVMTPEMIRRKTKKLQAKTRETLIRGITVSLLVIGLSSYGIAFRGSTVLRLVFALAIAWSVAGQYFTQRGVRDRAQPEEPGVTAGLESYRREVERRRYLSGRFLLWSLAPVSLTVAALIVLILSFGINGRGMAFEGALSHMIPFLTLLAAWIVGVFILRIRDLRELQREIQELREIEANNRT